jgi:hypothetical protein
VLQAYFLALTMLKMPLPNLKSRLSLVVKDTDRTSDIAGIDTQK